MDCSTWNNDTIAALATAPGVGGISIVRVSGVDALSIGRKLCDLPDPIPSRTALLRKVHNRLGAFIDEGLILFFPEDHSFTGEPVLEIQGHGGLLQSKQLLETVLEAGARLASPGEFSRRAFHNGRLSLDQAEALADLAVAETVSALTAARHQFLGGLGNMVAPYLAEALQLLTEAEASLDFPDEVTLGDGFGERAQLLSLKCEKLSKTHDKGKLLREGARIVIAGPPNAGKSSLFNRILGMSKALVDAEPGTTRDSLEALIEVAGLPCTLVDTAGLRPAESRVESMGIEATKEQLAQAALVLWLSAPDAEVRPPETEPERTLQVLNKADLASPDLGGPGDPLRVSARTGEGVSALLSAIERCLIGAGVLGSDWVVTHARHADLLARAAGAFGQASRTDALPLEMVSYELREGIAAMEELAGVGVRADLLDDIFSRFCIGK